MYLPTATLTSQSQSHCSHSLGHPCFAKLQPQKAILPPGISAMTSFTDIDLPMLINSACRIYYCLFALFLQFLSMPLHQLALHLQHFFAVYVVSLECHRCYFVFSACCARALPIHTGEIAHLV